MPLLGWPRFCVRNACGTASAGQAVPVGGLLASSPASACPMSALAPETSRGLRGLRRRGKGYTASEVPPSLAQTVPRPAGHQRSIADPSKPNASGGRRLWNEMKRPAECIALRGDTAAARGDSATGDEHKRASRRDGARVAAGVAFGEVSAPTVCGRRASSLSRSSRLASLAI